MARKAGGLPVWLWVALAVAVTYWYLRYGPGAQKPQQKAATARRGKKR